MQREEKDEGGVEYVEVLAILELLTRPLRETLESGEMTRCHDDDSIPFFESGDVVADAVDDAGTFERAGSVTSLDLACVDKDVLCVDTHN